MTAPPLPPDLEAQLARVPRSRDGSLEYAPCRVRLRSGEVLDRVVLVPAAPFLRQWGEIFRRDALDPADIAAIEDSPRRLPAELATTIYDAGESGMGYFVFTVHLRDGRALPFSTGNCVDFPDWPPDAEPREAVGVTPHAGREHFVSREQKPHTGSAPFRWCLYEPA